MKDIDFSKWSDGIVYEIAFWNNVYRWKHTFQGMMNWSKYGGIIDLEQFDANAFLTTVPTPLVLDVGSGMSYAPGNHVERHGQQEKLDIHYIDPLAFQFNNILHAYHKQLPEIEFGMIEYLSAFYPDHNVDMVIVQNALDHSANPIKGLYEALDTLRIQGVLYLNHHPNEAVTEQYKGFHQYNICQEEGNLIIWNQSERWNINELFAPIAKVEVYSGEDEHVIAVIRKTAEVPASLLCDKNDKKVLCQQIMAQMFWQNNVSGSIMHKLSYWKFNTIQFFAQALPYDLKMKVKKLIKQA